jgi:hypothetical protein
MRFGRSLLWLSILLLGTLLALGTAVHVLTPLGGEVPPPAWADDYDLTAQPADEIEPGTVIDRGPPSGWSHLVIKSLPRIKPSEVAKLPWVPVPGGRAELERRVRWMFTAFTADVVVEEHGVHRRHRLRAIGLGLGADVHGRDTVLTIDSAKRVGAELDLFQELTLKTGASVQKQSRIVIHGPLFALIDTPVTFRCDKRNRSVRFRYALLVDAPTGRLDVICWRIGAEGGECADLTRAVLLSPNTIDEAELIVDLSGFTAGIPGELAFGVDDLPPHRLVMAFAPSVAALTAKTRYTPEEAHELQMALRGLLPSA